MTKPLSSELQDTVRELAIAGVRSTHIAVQLGINRNTVIKYRKAMRLSSKPILPETKILPLLRRCIEQRTIARTLKVPYRQVSAFARTHGFARRPHWRPTTKQIVEIIDLALAHRHSIAEIARIVKGPYKPVLKICHRVLECERFISGGQGRKVALDSYLPQKWAKNKIGVSPDDMTSLALRLVDKICTHFLSGALPAPANDNNFVEAISTIVIPDQGSPDLRGCEREPVRQYFEANLREAITTLRTAQSGVVH